MFIPRQVRHKTESSKKNACFPGFTVPASSGENQQQQQQQQQQQDQKKEKRPTKRKRAQSDSSLPGDRAVLATVVPEDADQRAYLNEVRCGLELLLSDYAYTETESRAWILERERQVGGDGRYIHLSAFLESQIFAKCRPEVTQAVFQRAVESGGAEGVLELSSDRHHLRRRNPVTLSAKSSRDWDRQTIYVEPHLSSLALSPRKLAHYLLCHNNLPSSFFPIQNIITGKRPSYAFIVLSSSVEDTDARAWPSDWVVLTKPEWKKRDLEYQELRVQDSKRSFRPTHRLDRVHHRPKPRMVELTTRSQFTDHHQEYPRNLLVYLSNLHPSTTKAGIASFVNHQVDKYFRKKAQAQQRSDNKEVASATCGNTSTTPNLRIAYTDHVAGASTATIRLSSATDAEKVITTFSIRQLIQPGSSSGRESKSRDSDDAAEIGKPVTAQLLTGERERIYWEEFVWKRKGNGRKGSRRDDWYGEDKPELVYDGFDESEQSIAEKEFKEYLSLKKERTATHIRFED